eukprot:12164393-Alexandrium_andersonii.AAC.1
MSSADAGSASSTGGKIPEGWRCRRTPRGAPSRSQPARSPSGSPATRANAPTKVSFRPSSVPGSGDPRAWAIFNRTCR